MIMGHTVRNGIAHLPEGRWDIRTARSRPEARSLAEARRTPYPAPYEGTEGTCGIREHRMYSMLGTVGARWGLTYEGEAVAEDIPAAQAEVGRRLGEAEAWLRERGCPLDGLHVGAPVRGLSEVRWDAPSIAGRWRQPLSYEGGERCEARRATDLLATYIHLRWWLAEVEARGVTQLRVTD